MDANDEVIGLTDVPPGPMGGAHPATDFDAFSLAEFARTVRLARLLRAGSRRPGAPPRRQILGIIGALAFGRLEPGLGADRDHFRGHRRVGSCGMSDSPLVIADAG